MIGLRGLASLLAALALAGCGPDCARYCDKLNECAGQALPPVAFDRAQCLLDCDASGGDKTRVIQCVIDHSCTDLGAGHCSPTGQPVPVP